MTDEELIDDEFFQKFKKNSGNVLRETDFHGGKLYVSVGGVLGIMKTKDMDISGWNRHLTWTKTELDSFVLLKDFKIDFRFWGISHEYLLLISDFIGKNEIVVKFNPKLTVGMVDCGKWMFLIAPCLIPPETLSLYKDVQYFTETTSIDDLW